MFVTAPNELGEFVIQDPHIVVRSGMMKAYYTMALAGLFILVSTRSDGSPRFARGFGK